MAIPPSVLFAAAAKIAKDERAHKAAKYLFDSGKEMLAARQRAKVEKSSTNIGAIEAEPVTPGRRKHGLRGEIERRLRFRSGAKGDLIRFTYTDEHGLSTRRMVGNWRSDGSAVTGLCLNMKRECQFDVRGVSDWEEIAVEAGSK